MFWKTWTLLSDLWQDLRFGLRLIAKSPRLTTAIVLTLGLGIGANALVFSVVRAVVLRPLAYEQPERLIQFWSSGTRSGGQGDWVSFPDFRDWSRENRVFEEAAVYRYSLATISGDKEPQSVLGLQVTDRLFEILGVKPVFGRTFLSGEDSPGRETVAVISHALWQRRYGGDPATVGRQVDIDGKPYSIIGVMPPSFYFPDGVPEGTTVIPVDVWIPMRNAPDLEQRGSHNFWAIARLKTNVTLEQARADMDSIAANLARQYPVTNKDMGVTVAHLQDHRTGSVRPA
ncbi:MAG TPA: ABC transporter permease, partial [Blastocatellia bacterium]|nr:ABC transporter permease [Blastocatellia bacterium]